MLIHIDETKHSSEQIRALLINNNVKYNVLNNVYWSTCMEEIEQAIDCSDVIRDDCSFYDMLGDEADNIIYELTDDIYNSREANSAFQDLAEAAQLLVNRKINSLKEAV